MSAQSDPFQRMVAMITRLMGNDAVRVVEPFLIPDPVSTQQREIDVVTLRNVDGDWKKVGIECRDRVGAQDVTWIEQVATKLPRLGIDIMIVVSRNGFSGPAKQVAESLGIQTITPGEISPEFVGSIVNRAEVVALHNLPFALRLLGIQFEFSDGYLEWRRERPVDQTVFLPGGIQAPPPHGLKFVVELCCSRALEDRYNQDPPLFPDLDRPFGLELAVPRYGDEPIRLEAVDSRTGTTELAAIQRMIGVYDVGYDRTDAALTHFEFDGGNYSWAAADLGDIGGFELVLTEDADGNLRMASQLIEPHQ